MFYLPRLCFIDFYLLQYQKSLKQIAKTQGLLRLDLQNSFGENIPIKIKRPTLTDQRLSICHDMTDTIHIFNKRCINYQCGITKVKTKKTCSVRHNVFSGQYLALLALLCLEHPSRMWNFKRYFKRFT